jgi:predicted ester cyclase
MITPHEQLVRAVTEVIWNGRIFDRIAEFYCPHFVADYRPYAPLREGHAGVRAMVEGACVAFPDYREELLDLITDGHRVAIHLRISGTQLGPWGPLPPTGRAASFEELAILTLHEGRIHHQRGIVDNLAALRQLGVVPSPPAP